MIKILHSKNRRDGGHTLVLPMAVAMSYTARTGVMAGHTPVLPMGLLVTVPHSKNRRDGWTYTCLTHGTDSDGPTQQEQA